MDTDEAPSSQRYQRHFGLEGWGSAGQKKLGKTRVLIVGLGGLGCPAARYLAAAGVGTLILMDPDKVELSNLQRQVLYDDADCGSTKVSVAGHKLRAQNPLIKVVEIKDYFRADIDPDFVASLDLVLDCTDNFASRFAIHDICRQFSINLVQAALYTWEGQLAVFDFGEQTQGPCLRCLWPEQPLDGCVGTCGELGVAGALAGALGSLQALSGLRILLGLPCQKRGELFILDGRNMQSRILNWEVCTTCSCQRVAKYDKAHVLATHPTSDFDQLNQKVILDIRETHEIGLDDYSILENYGASRITHLSKSKLVSMSAQAIAQHCGPNNEPVTIICSAGVRSAIIVDYLKKNGYQNFVSLDGGMMGIKQRR